MFVLTVQSAVQIVDTGTGIKNLNAAFTLGCRNASESPLNEHGFGLKHALASANPENNEWSICTRTKEDFDNNRYIKISSPYLFDNFKATICDISDNPWEGKYNSTGTSISFVCNRELYRTLIKGLKGNWQDFRAIATLLYEDLGFVYSEVIKSQRARIDLRVVPINGNPEQNPVGALEPDWLDTVRPGMGTEKYDLGKGLVDIEYHFGVINPKADSQMYDFDNTTAKKYYKASMSTSGVEIRINGRLICYNVFKEIWNNEKHNVYNSFLVIINLRSKNLKALPKTRTSKNGLREGDPQLDKLYKWIFGKLNVPPKNSQDATLERDLFVELRDKLRYSAKEFGYGDAPIDCEHYAFTTTGNSTDSARIDLYVNIPGKISLYEGKLDKTTMKDVYQLRMYWDGLVYDGSEPTEGILVSAEHPQSVKDMIQLVNNMKDMKGNKYNFVCKTWMDLGIQYNIKKSSRRTHAESFGFSFIEN